MSQSAVLVGLLAAGFLLYLAAKGRLPTYTAALWGPVTGGDTGKKPDSKSDDIKDDALDFGAKFLPPPFNMIYEFGDNFL